MGRKPSWGTCERLCRDCGPSWGEAELKLTTIKRSPTLGSLDTRQSALLGPLNAAENCGGHCRSNDGSPTFLR